ncbi:MAG: hypothetical protein ACW98F_01635 [Candidatus Hodarchaeales archaeon]|jgi:hypothetical protein
MQSHRQNRQKTLYESFFGGEGYSLNGPLFYLVSGSICFVITIIILLAEIYIPDIFSNIYSLRPGIKFPFYGILLILTVSGTVIGLFFGFLGIFWRNLKQ